MAEAQKKSLIARGLLKLAIRAKLAQLERGDFSQDTVWDRLIFNKARSRFGGQVKRVISGSASLSPEVAKFSRAIFSCFFIEGYGQTECIVGTSQTVNDHRLGETGVPTPVNHIKLVDVPEKNYFARDNVGEICIQSKAVFKGYLHDEVKTHEAISKDGWLHTGDIGRWTEHRTLQIIDRKKNIYKLSQGEYIAPEKIENIYSRSRFISQVYVYGDSLQNALVAIVVLDDDMVKAWMTENSINEGSNAIHANNSKLWQTVFNDMIELGKKRGLMSYEQIKNMAFITEPFTIENGLLTPTFKARRHAVEKKYKNVLQDLYKVLQK
ncbi:unnamed protein product [Rotaria sp. Silwood2]|nr:unnamed protein product [Rotaria sp. Silwood2]CAF3014698.1 unnamed protein product [Rotaria sp. Silwood2]CAF3290674.1 unnamed protein product [Rotaria sp. Silwood2]CAF3364446.1 unnamed protein product [Rotaria sp. Silwood2]CAF4055175.1 unnamed protein product [Rotaria sp. Silwood2]